MEKDIDFMAYVDETTPPELVLKMLLAAQRDKLQSLEEKAFLSNENALLKIKLFGRSSEKIKKQKPDLPVFDEAKATPQVLEEDAPLIPETSALDAALGNVTTPQKEPKKKGRKPIPGCYQRHDVIHDLPDHQKQCACGCDLSKIGEDVSEQLDVIPAQIYVKRHRRFKYACKVCQETVKIAPVQSQAIPKTLGAPGLLAHVAVMKFDDHLPLYRQSEIWARLGVELSRATLSSWVLKMGTAVEPIVRHLQNHLIQSAYVQADETVCQVLKTPGKSDTTQSYMWVYMTGNSPKPAVVYEYQESRKGDFAKAFLKGFQGVLQTDGYSGYRCVKEQPGD
jgi:transposase